MPPLILVLALTLAACQPVGAPIADPMAPSCGAEALQPLLGQPLARFTAPPAAKAVRVIGPDTAVTMDFRPDRLNVEHDAQRVITRIYCG
jgi:hypothetical protein